MQAIETIEIWNDTKATTATEARQATIKQVVGTLAEDVMKNINDLRRQLDDLEKLVLSNAARVSDNLNDHVEICGLVQHEVARITGLVAELRRNQINQTEVNGVGIEH